MVHLGVGRFAGFITELCSPSARLGRSLVEEIAARVPLPYVDDTATIAARGIQATGITMCLLTGQALIECECFVDVVTAEGSDRVAEVLRQAAMDWTGFRHLGAAVEPQPVAVSGD
jgi:hypothetical protein